MNPFFSLALNQENEEDPANLVRPARFELATYGFVDQARLYNLLKSLE
jgi:hypothetical protein